MMKPQFQTRLLASRLPSKKTINSSAWRIEQPLNYWSAIIGQVSVPVGFVTDFASVPRLPFAYLLFGDRVHAPAVIHDYLLQSRYPARLITWATAADVFCEAMHADGVPWYQRHPMALGVRLHGVTKWRAKVGAA